MPRPYSKTNIHAIPRHDLHRTGRGDACVARGYGRIFGEFAGEACLAPTARQTFTPSPGTISIEPVGATHASPAGVAGFLGDSRARHASPLRSHEPAHDVRILETYEPTDAGKRGHKVYADCGTDARAAPIRDWGGPGKGEEGRCIESAQGLPWGQAGIGTISCSMVPRSSTTTSTTSPTSMLRRIPGTTGIAPV